MFVLSARGMLGVKTMCYVNEGRHKYRVVFAQTKTGLFVLE